MDMWGVKDTGQQQLSDTTPDTQGGFTVSSL